MERTGLKLLLSCVFIFVICFIAYIPAIKGGFIWDDNTYLTANPLITAPDGLWRIWLSTDTPSQYFPLVYTMFRLEHRLWGFDPIPYHIDNVAIHVICSLLLWQVLRRLSIPGAFLAAALFALHPVNVESVAWITERKNVLMLFFSLLSLLFWLDLSLRTLTAPRRVFLYVLSLLCYALALFSKTTACVLPVALILVLWLKRVPLRPKRFLLVAPYVAMGLAMGLLSVWWEHTQQATGRLVDIQLSFVEHLLLAARALWFYAAKIFFPVNLTFSYPRWKIDSADPFQYIWLLACLAVVAVLWRWRTRLGRGPIAAVLFFVAALSPMLGFIPLYTFVYTWFADHYQYMAAIALITLAAAAGSRLFARLGKYAKISATLVSAVLLLTCAVLTWRQCRIYANPEALWRDTLEKNPDSWLAHNNIGRIFLMQNEPDETIYHLTRVLELLEDEPVAHPYNIAVAHFNLAVAYRFLDRYDDAIEHFRSALDAYPDDAQTHYELADALIKQGDLRLAIVHLHSALDLAVAAGADDLADLSRKRLELYKNKSEPDPNHR
jgi:tetratricopeptide (TPR) repeat protein